MIYTVITLDIKTSKASENRARLQEHLQNLCIALNEKKVESKFDIVLGDEIQGLVAFNRDIIDFIDIIVKHKLEYQFDIHLGIGIGQVSTNINEIDVEKNDGPAFHYARDAVQLAKKKNQPTLLIHPANYQDLEHLMNLYHLLLCDLSPHAFQILINLEQNMSQKEIALKMNVKQSSISRTINRFHISEIMNLKSTIGTFTATYKEIM